MSSSTTGSLTQQLLRIFHALANPPAWQPPSSSTSSTSSTQDAAISLIALIAEAQRLASSLSLISANDELRDVQTGTLRAFLLPSALGEALNRVRTAPQDLSKRKDNLQRSTAAFQTFLRSLLQLKILPAPSGGASEAGLGLLAAQARAHLTSAAGPATLDPTSRRALKIRLFQLERSITRALDTYRESARSASQARARGGLRAQKEGFQSAHAEPESRDAVTSMPSETAFDLLVLPRGGASGSVNDASSDEDESDREDEDKLTALASSGTIPTPKTLRAYLLLLLALHASKAIASLDSARQELDILNSMSAAAAASSSSRRVEGERERARDELESANGARDEWRIDRRFDAGAPGALMDPAGKVLRPFQITSSTAAATGAGAMGTLADDGMDARRKIREGVFQPGHRLPSMSIDEFLEEEERRGNVIRGGGPEGAAKATPREARALRAEADGTLEAEEALEEARREAIEWDAFTEANPKGAGNTMNRG